MPDSRALEALQIEVVEGAALPDAAKADVLALCERAYGRPMAQYFADLGTLTHVIGRIDGALAAHAAWVTRLLQTGEAPPMRTAYVELVATDPAHQRRGYAAAVMRRLVTAVEDYDIAALCPSDEGEKLYLALGWQSWHGPLSIRDASGTIPTPGERVMVYRLPATPALDLRAPLSGEWRKSELW